MLTSSISARVSNDHFKPEFALISPRWWLKSAEKCTPTLRRCKLVLHARLITCVSPFRK